jgi:hypothetical protein
MSGNEFEIVIRLPKSDGFHSRSDRHLAEIVQRRVADFLTENPPQWRGPAEVEIRKPEERQD